MTAGTGARPCRREETADHEVPAVIRGMRLRRPRPPSARAGGTGMPARVFLRLVMAWIGGLGAVLAAVVLLRWIG